MFANHQINPEFKRGKAGQTPKAIGARRKSPNSIWKSITLMRMEL